VFVQFHRSHFDQDFENEADMFITSSDDWSDELSLTCMFHMVQFIFEFYSQLLCVFASKTFADVSVKFCLLEKWSCKLLRTTIITVATAVAVLLTMLVIHLLSVTVCVSVCVCVCVSK